MPRAAPSPRAIPAELTLDSAVAAEHLVDFLRRETRRSGFRRLILGLSGGIDSAVSAALAARALGSRHVLGVLMPYRTSSRSSVSDARRAARLLRIPTETVPITPMVDAYFRHDPRAGRRRRGNLMARARMAILYDLSDRDRRLVVGTSNKTEILLGYGTIFGDLASALNPVGDLYKTQLRQMALHLGIPGDLVWKVPTADLWAGQSDEGEIGYSYEAIDRLLLRLVELRESPDDLVAAGFPKRMVRAIVDRVTRSQFKRRPPIVAKLTRRAVNLDFRYPRDWGA